MLQRLDHLADLGVDVLWLSPVYPSPQADNGYDISDYQGVDPLFGTLEQLDELIAAAARPRHEAGHGPGGQPHQRPAPVVRRVPVAPDVTEARLVLVAAARAAGCRPGEPGAEPTNWRSFFSGPTWELDQTSGEYYLHLFTREQPDLNWENPEVRQAIYAMMRWWLDRGVDGFRMDVINMISKDVAPDGHLHDGPPLPGTGLGDGSASYLCGPRIHEFLHEMHREVFAGRPGALLTVGEMPGRDPGGGAAVHRPGARRGRHGVPVRARRTSTTGSVEVGREPLQLRDLKASFGRWQAGLADVGWNSLYWDNHDQPRAVSRFGDDSPAFRRDSATCLATLLHLHRGTPYVYQGEELGMANYPFAGDRRLPGRRVDQPLRATRWPPVSPRPTVLAGLRRMSRDNARTPVQWDASPSAGFTTGTPWLPVNPDHVEWNAAAQRDDPHSVLAHYRRLIALRHADPVVALGDFTMLLPDHDEVYAFTRALDGATLLVVCNREPQPRSRWRDLLPEAVGAELVLGNLASADPAVLAPWEARVLRA